MKWVFFLALGSSSFVYGQTTKAKMEKAITDFLFRYSINDVASYQSIRFSETDSIFEISDAGNELRDSLINHNYDNLLKIANDSSLKIENYKNTINEFNEKLESIDKQHNTCIGYSINHSFKAKNRKGDITLYNGSFLFNTEGKIIESEITQDNSYNDKGI